ncbi:MAG: hypothetical protein EAZ57_06930 [Cytophagales bacterium]|nr:MAG: hypothetical protein EAZ67_07605 [Cytophagales bacterium]TAF60590.1 MAG: hypothetical protein EAZ57_06930 [Cytophagales bacterium]
MSSQKLIIQIMYGGLGDHLFVTPVPRLAKELGFYDQVFISNKSDFRHPDYKRLVWEMNPYIDGFTDEDGSFPYIDVMPYFEKDSRINILDAVLMNYHLFDGNYWHEPELYFKPKIREDLKDKVIYDPNYVSNVGMVSGQTIEKFFKKNHVTVDFQLKVRGNTNFPIGNALQTLETPTIEDYCSAIVSCKAFYCLTSGGATLASALEKPSTCFYAYGQGKIFHHSKWHVYQYAGSRASDFNLFRDRTSLAVKSKLPFVHNLLKKLLGK